MTTDRWYEIVAAIEKAVDEHAFDDEDGNGWMPLGPLTRALHPEVSEATRVEWLRTEL